jgi:phosphoglycerate dehydrogenase-like enzyme
VSCASATVLPRPKEPNPTVNPRRPKALLWMKPYAFSQVISDEEIFQLRELVDLVDIRQDERPTDESLADPCLAEVEILLTGWGNPRMDARMLEALPSLRAIFHAAGSVKPFVTDEMWDRGIRVFSAAGMNAKPVGEFTYAMIVLALKRVWPRVAAQRESGLYVPDDPYLAGGYGTTVGLLGLSKTGRVVREQLRGMDVHILAYDPLVSKEEAAALGVELLSLEEVFARAHVVSCHIPLLDSTRGMLRREHFSLMRPGATFINTARGAIVNETELAEVLRERTDLWALLDVLAVEPPPPGALLPKLPNVVITPHLAGSLGPECLRMSRAMISEIERYLSNEPLECEVLRVQLPVCA